MNPARDYAFWERLVDGQLQMRIRLIVLELVIEIRLMFFDERSFQDECFGLIIGDDEFDVSNLSDELFSLDTIAEFAGTAR